MKPRTITWLLLTGLLTFLLVQVYWRKPVSGTPKTRRPAAIIPPGNRRPPLHVAPPAAATMPSASEPAPCVPANPGELKFADDAASKHGAFWLEQPLEWTGAPNAHLFDLYLALDQQTQSGLRVRLKGDELALEQGGTAALAAAKVSAHASLARPLTGSTVLGVLWSRGELSAWLGAQEVLHWKPEDTSGTGRRDAGAPSFNGPSAVHVFSPGLRLGAGRTLDLGAIHFDDTFMRNTADGAWSPFSGKWELTGMAFPERSANPFSLRASFGFEQPVDDKLYAGRTHAQDYGLGIMISGYEGTLHVCRITGGGPAARAGLGEDDIFLSIDGISVDNFDHHQLMALLLGRFGAEVRLRMLRPGEGQPREVCITREHFKWGTPAEGIPIPPVREPGQLGADEVALIAAGEAGWSNYAAEVAVKPLGSGGMGLAIAVLSPQDYLLFRWRGPDWQRTVPAGQPVATPPGKLPPFSLPLQKGEAGAGRPGTDRLQLVRVSGGKETVLQELAAGYRPYEFYRLAMDWSGDAVACSVDGNQVFAASVPDLKRGQIALYALKGDPVFFDDVRVYADRKALAAAHHPEQMVNQIFANEEDMQVWANPAQEWDRDLKTGWAVHKARFPGEQAVVLNKPRFTELTVALDCSDDPEKSWGQFSIKDGLACLRGFNCQSADAQVGRGPFQRIVVRNAERAEADVDGVRLSPPVDKSPKKLPAFRGDSIAIRGLKNLGDPNAVHVSSSNVLEYTFDAAPVDWKVACGRWGLLNKWICDPRWSWFGGRTKSLAALWNKFVFSGDITVDGHVALMMQQEDPPYERPGDYNIAICGDGVNLDSGYTLVFAGDNNSWTRLYRKGKMVAESTQEEHRLFSDKIHHPDKPQLHQRWFHLKLEKRGPTVSFYRDDALAFSFTDPEPLQEGRVAFWTLDNGFLLSRVRIAHETLKPGPFEPRRANLYDDGRVINMFDGEVYTAVAPQALPGAIQAALAAPPNAFQPADADVVQASSPASVGQASSPADRAAIPAYRVLNTIGGGPFALQWKNLSVDAEARSVLRFAYCIEPGANVDLYLLDISTNRPFDPRRNGAYRVRLTGPRESDEFTPLAGEIPNVKADGRWHAVQYDLNPSWRALWQQRGYKRPRTYPVLRPMIGNLANQGYLLAGLNGNHAGAAYSISDIQTFSPRETSSAAPSVQSVIWPFDPAGDGRSVAVVFGGGGSAGIMDESLQAELNGVAVPRELVAFDHLRQTLRVDLAGFNLPPLPAAPKLNLKLPVFQDRARNFSAGPFSASYTFDPEKALQAAKPAAAPVVTFEFAGGGDVVPSGTALRLSEVSPLSPIARLQESSDAPPWAPYGRQRS
ncbi:MAG: PDZ domain-containing protein, partial [Planctomycetota bacterium]